MAGVTFVDTEIKLDRAGTWRIDGGREEHVIRDLNGQEMGRGVGAIDIVVSRPMVVVLYKVADGQEELTWTPSRALIKEATAH